MSLAGAVIMGMIWSGTQRGLTGTLGRPRGLRAPIV